MLTGKTNEPNIRHQSAEKFQVLELHYAILDVETANIREQVVAVVYGLKIEEIICPDNY